MVARTPFYYSQPSEEELALAAELRLGGYPRWGRWAKMGNTMYPAQVHLTEGHCFTVCGIASQGGSQFDAQQYCLDCLKLALMVIHRETT